MENRSSRGAASWRRCGPDPLVVHMASQRERHRSDEQVVDGNLDESPSGATEGGAAGTGAWYGIAEAARQASVHQQTLRHYERLGLIAPARKGTRPQSPRLYSERDIERVIHIRQLIGDLGVNLAGVETILNMRDRMEAMRREMDGELARLRRLHEEEMHRLLALIEELRR
jgi:MerR family transcriptional regulator/heat shock protein HspR